MHTYLLAVDLARVKEIIPRPCDLLEGGVAARNLIGAGERGLAAEPPRARMLTERETARRL